MTIKSFFLVTLFEWAVLLALHLLYFRGSLGQGDFAYYLYLGLIAFFTLVLCRRLGIISFLEAAFIAFFWFAVFLFLDLLVTSAFLGTSVFRQRELWVGYGCMALVLFLLHKKRHIHMRHKLHGHHHHPPAPKHGKPDNFI